MGLAAVRTAGDDLVGLGIVDARELLQLCFTRAVDIHEVDLGGWFASLSAFFRRFGTADGFCCCGSPRLVFNGNGQAGGQQQCCGDQCGFNDAAFHGISPGFPWLVIVWRIWLASSTSRTLPEGAKKPGSVTAPRLSFRALPGHGEPCPGLFVTVNKRRSRYFACMALMSATLPARWQSVH